jgi:hypothetical protein
MVTAPTSANALMASPATMIHVSVDISGPDPECRRGRSAPPLPAALGLQLRSR